MKALRLTGVIVGVVIALVVVAVMGAAARGNWLLHRTHDRPTPALSVSGDSASVARGAYLAVTRCSGCHSAQGELPLQGGIAFHMGPLGSVYPPNLTPGGAELAKDSDGQLARAIREGVTGDGHAMIIMPSGAFRSMSDSDLHALLAYLRTQPAVTTADTTHQYTFMTAALVGFGMLPTSVQPAITAPIADVTPSAGLAYGQYLTTQSGCMECHGRTLHGGQQAKVNIAKIADAHTFEEFAASVRQGRGVGGGEVAATMPWRSFASLTDQDMRAIYEYVKSVD